MLRRLSEAHGAIGRFGLNLLLAFALFNGLCWLAWRSVWVDPPTARYGRELVAAGYPGLSSAELDELLRETWTRRHVYDPFVQFTESPTTGRFVNVDPAGFRLANGPAPWPPDPEAVNVFVFGGSTLFGYGLADDDTIPARLEPLLAGVLGRRVRCYNFGRGAYYSTQEKIFFGEQLLAGLRPDLAVFVDGLNDFYYGEPMHSRHLARLFSDRPDLLFLSAVRHLPALDVPLRWLGHRSRRPDPTRPPLDPAYDDAALLDPRIERYLGNLRHHPFAAWGFEDLSPSGYGYPRLARRLEDAPQGPDFLWLGDLQDGLAARRP